MNLGYYSPVQSGASARYSGDISSWNWTQSGQGQKAYAFSYDGAHRLTSGQYYSGGSATNALSEKGITYDRAGNITSLTRYGNSGGATTLAYSYTGNRRSSFGYDVNGNVTNDATNSLQTSYNLINLPAQTKNGSTVKASHTYLSDGTKASVLNASGAGYDYNGSFVFSSSAGGSRTLESVAFSGGRIRRSGSTYSVDYYVTDHLGSVRAIVNASGAIVEQNDYYPFGTRHANGLSTLSTNRWRFSGKEEYDAAFGIAYSDFGARLYDRTAWTAIDPLAEKYFGISPYSYCAGNPVRFVDLDGRSTRVKRLENGTYEVVGVDINDDHNIYISERDDAGKWISTGVSIGMTPSVYSFVEGDNSSVVKAIIDPSNNDGLNFIQDLTQRLRPLAYYMFLARNKHRFDFKVTNGTNRVINSKDDKYKYRGMPIYTSSDGITFYGSARDVGNLVAGYYAAAYGITWEESRTAFDSYNGDQEPFVSQYAQRFGYNLGASLPEEERLLRRNLNFLIPASLPALQFIKRILKK